jgi:hypothetical protein
MVLTLTAYDVWKLAAFWSATHHGALAAPSAASSLAAGASPAPLRSAQR